MEKDPRILHMSLDPKFRRIPRKERKVKIDKRFQSMFKDARFKVKSSVDKRGRPSSFASSENFRRFYALSSSAESSDTEADDSEVEGKEKRKKDSKTVKDKKKIKKKNDQLKANDSLLPESEDDDHIEVLKKSSKKGTLATKSKDKSLSSTKNSATTSKDLKREKIIAIQESSDDDSEESDDSSSELPKVDEEDGETVSSSVRDKLRDLSVDYARGGGQLFSDSSSSDDDSDESSVEGANEEVEHAWGELDKDAEETDEATFRLALCNMDWERVKAEDLMVLLSSFLPPTGAITKIAVYPSEFGLKCMKEEEKRGPLELAEQKPLEEDESDNGEEQFDVERLRRYEMRRLKYYYAIVDCDTVATASHIYTECDGLEYESSSARLDLRFVPDDETFDHEPREECTSLPAPGKYIPRYFKTGALTQAKFELTWDETDPRRAELSHRLWASKDKELGDEDLRGVLASSSNEESDEDDAEAGAKYRALLDDGSGKDKEEKELQVSWGIDLQAKADQRATESRRKAAGLGELTPFEQLMQKKKEKRKEKRLLRERQRKDIEDEGGEKATFSDDELPSDLEDLKAELTEAESKNEKKNKKGKGKRAGKKKNIEERDPQQKAELELLLMDEDGEGDRHFNLGTRQPSKQKNMDDEFEVNVKDPRFSALYSSHHYNLDPADPHYKASRGTQAIVSEKLRLRQNADKEGSTLTVNKTNSNGGKRPRDAELSQLVRSVKRKTEMSLASKKLKTRK